MQNRVRELRQTRRISQLKMSMDIGVSQEAISAFERGQTVPGVSTVIRIAQYFGVTVDYLLFLSASAKYKETISVDESYVLTLYQRLTDLDKEKAKSYILGLLDGE